VTPALITPRTINEVKINRIKLCIFVSLDTFIRGRKNTAVSKQTTTNISNKLCKVSRELRLAAYKMNLMSKIQMYWTTGSQVLYLQANDTGSYPFIFTSWRAKNRGSRLQYSVCCYLCFWYKLLIRLDEVHDTWHKQLATVGRTTTSCFNFLQSANNNMADARILGKRH